jgi:hypothetical protein
MPDAIWIALISSAPGVLIAVIGLISNGRAVKRTQDFELARLQKTLDAETRKGAQERVVETRDMYQRALKIAIEHRGDISSATDYFERFRDAKAWLHLAGSTEVSKTFAAYLQSVGYTEERIRNEGLDDQPEYIQDWSDVDKAFDELVKAMNIHLDQLRAA